ncbi:DNA polymerase III subunit chi [Marinobacterium sediminicola]|uniref:DNA polymerase III, chi subunit n=1 Tax=Marinobacterium sediminicola TaxID=518898 RepID=A0ABY1S477_9GAMM|nr:DNA polymerase III subunit chi [Marinobacterium sediminicola]ULG69852.1 DNA polymerase III subunit chi [Marinobacterium sediminicola]SMR77868.1 DNA polymerase III, chi subunit [Marinobacterium sediminicola]
MSRADYYILPDSDPDSRAAFLCRLCDKILGLGLRVFISTEHETAARQLDHQLWSAKPESFVPHVLLGQPPNSPIEIGWGDQLPDHRQVFVNLSARLPDAAFDFERIVEIVVQTPEVLAATRDNYARCRDRGIELHRTDMRRRG